MFKKQVEELREMVVEKEIIINRMEEEIKSQKELLKDAKQALTSLERVQSKYEEQEEEVNETALVSI